MRQQVERMYNYLKGKGLAPTFDKAGIYFITIDEIMVYIGKSRNMLVRMAEHYVDMNAQKKHKYQVLSDASKAGYKIRFHVFYYAKSTEYEQLKQELGEREGHFIRTYLPPLNYQIPKAENWREYTVNKRAKTVTLAEILSDNT